MKKMVPDKLAWFQGAVPGGCEASPIHWNSKGPWILRDVCDKRTANFPNMEIQEKSGLSWWRKWMQKAQDCTGCFSAWYWSWKRCFLVELGKGGFCYCWNWLLSFCWLSRGKHYNKVLSNIKLKESTSWNHSTKLSGFYSCIGKGTSSPGFNPDNAIGKGSNMKSLFRVLKVKGFFTITYVIGQKNGQASVQGFELFQRAANTPVQLFGGESGDRVALWF